MELGLRVEYDTHKFGAAEIATVVARFERVLEAMTADADQLVSAIGALTEDEQRHLDRWANRAVLTRPTPALPTIIEMFTAQVARIPDEIAVTCGAATWSYRELDQASNRLARQLVARGAGPDATSHCCCRVPGKRSLPSWRC